MKAFCPFSYKKVASVSIFWSLSLALALHFVAVLTSLMDRVYMTDRHGDKS